MSAKMVQLATTLCEVVDPLVMEQHMSEDLLEKLEALGASNELIALWARRDGISAAVGEDQSLPVGVREGALRHIECIAKKVGCQWSAVFECAALFDAYCSRPGGTNVEAVPSLCVAVVKIVRTVSDATAHIPGTELAEEATVVAQWLWSSGHTSQRVTITEEEVYIREREVLDAVDWNVQIPTIESWASVLLARLNAITSGQYLQWMQWMWQTHLFHTMRLILFKQAGPKSEPGRAACGLMCLALIAARLLPSDSLKPDHLDASEWDQLLAHGQPQGRTEQCLLSVEQSCELLSHLTLVTGRSLGALRVDCANIAGLMFEAMTDINQQRKQISV